METFPLHYFHWQGQLEKASGVLHACWDALQAARKHFSSCGWQGFHPPTHRSHSPASSVSGGPTKEIPTSVTDSLTKLQRHRRHNSRHVDLPAMHCQYLHPRLPCYFSARFIL